MKDKNYEAIHLMNFYGFDIEDTQELKECMNGSTLEGEDININIEFGENDIIEGMWFYQNNPIHI